VGPPLSSSCGLSCPGAERERVDHQREMEQHFGRGVRHALALGVARPVANAIFSFSISKTSKLSHNGNACSNLTIHCRTTPSLGRDSSALRTGIPHTSPRDGTTHKKAQCHNPAAAEHKNVRVKRVIHVNVPPLLSGGDATGNAPFLSQPPLRGAHPSGNCTTRLHATVTVAAARVSRTQRVAYAVRRWYGSRGKVISVPAKM
jgi:hypothetical protein